MVGQSEPMRQLYSQILRAAETDSNVIIYGETGCGKDLVARSIHEYSGRKGNYVPVNCGAIPEQLLESEFFGHVKGAFSGAHANKDGYIGAAHGGTLFLDEIGELPLHLQVKLLRAIENKMYTPVGDNKPRKSSFRLIAATNQDLARMVREKKMRSDFYYRVHVLSITLPPLRERQGDIPLLVDAWMERRKCFWCCRGMCAWPWSVTTGPATCANFTIFWTGTWPLAKKPCLRWATCMPMPGWCLPWRQRRPPWIRPSCAWKNA